MNRVFLDSNVILYLLSAHTLMSEDMQHGMRLQGLQIHNPFLL